MVNAMHIAIVGNIGAGKTTLTEMLAAHYQREALFEPVEENPYLTDFYQDMQRWSFNLQVYFLNSRFKQLMEIIREKKNVIQDRTIYEDAYIFAANLHDMSLMSGRDYDTYIHLFNSLKQFIRPPDLLIYLRASIPTLIDNIQHRGRAYEEGIRPDYLNKLNEKYEKWIEGYTEGKLLVIDMNAIDFTNKAADFEEIVKLIDEKMKKD